MDQVSPHRLWIGNARDARDHQALLRLGIEAVIDLAAEETPAAPPRQLIYCRFPLVDASGNDPSVLAFAIDTVRNLLGCNKATLVACSAGMSRSPTVAAYAVAKLEHRPAAEVLAQVREQKATDVHPALWADAESACA